MFNRANLTPLEAAPKAFGAAGGSGGKPGRCSVYPLWRASVAGPPYRGEAPTGLYAQADDTCEPAIALGSRRGDRSTMNALGTRVNREQAAHTTARSPITDLSAVAVYSAEAAAKAGSREGGPVRRSLSTRRSLARRLVGEGGFTLAELLVSIGVLVVLVILFTQLLNSAATIMTIGNKRMDADSQARQLLDRMAIDFDQMVKRTDVDYFAKGTAAPNSIGGTMNGNDQIAFYSSVPGYYPTPSYQSPISLVAYRINQDTSPGNRAYLKLQRMGKGFIWSGVSPTDTPIVFLPLTISAMWPYATNQDLDAAYEVIGPDVFRFEYYYLLKWQPNPGATPYPAIFTDTPWDTRSGVAHTNVSGMQDVAAIVVAIAVIDPKSKVLLDNSAQVPPPDDNITRLGAQLIDCGNTTCPGCPSQTDWQTKPGQLLTQWQNKLNGIIDPNSPDYDPTLPRPAISGIRLYERYFYLSQ